VKPAVLTLVILAGAAGLSGCGQPDPAPPPVDAAVEAARASAREEAAATLEAARIAALWSYHEAPAGSGRQLHASLYSTNDVDTDGQGPRRVRLVFRDHPSWGRSAYLVLQGGDFNCDGSCTVPVRVDAADPKPMAARRPKTDDAIAMFINDARGLWRLTAGAERLSVEFPIAAGGARTATFEVAGLDRARMPGWD
jgi:hypothetical protein